MPHYSYRARTDNGKEVQGTLRAQSPERAASLLKSHGLLALDVTEVAESPFFSRSILGGRVNTRDLVLFSRQISVMIRAGVPVLQSLQALDKQVEKPAFKRLLQEVAYDVEGGESLSAALGKHPTVFSLFFLGVVRTGEASGRLSESLSILGDYLEQNYVFIRKVRSALMYPAFVLTAVVIVVAIMFYFVVPQLIAIFDEAAIRLPLPTRILIAVTDFTKHYWYVVGLVAVLLGIVARSYLKTADGQLAFSTLLLRLPGLNQLFKKLYLARLTSILHTLFLSDVSILESLRLARASLSNRVYQRILDNTIAAVKDGSTISSVWEQEPYIPPMLTTMIAIGEQSGEIERSLSEANRFFTRDVEEMLESVTVFLEPLLVIILGIGVGIVVAAVLLPIYNLVLVL